jgi:DNA sulfur modification protein DndD
LIQEQDYLLDEIKSANSKIANIELELAKNQKKLSELRIELNRRMKQNAAVAKVTHEIDIWDKVNQHLKRIYDELKEEIRLGVEKKTWEIFINLLDNAKEFVKFKINPDYSVVLLDQYKGNKIIDISAGQSLLLTLSFVAALRDPTGYKFPLVIDSPLGKIDGSVRYNIGNKLPDYLPDEQITFLATDTEYVAKIPLDPDEPERETIPFGALLQKKIPVKHFRIKKGDDGNSTISPAKFVRDDTNNEWKVVIQNV